MIARKRPRRKVGRPRKAPGAPTAHKLSPKMQVAISAIVEDNKTRSGAAKLAGLTEDAIRHAMRVVKEFYSSAVKAPLSFAKAKAAHALIKELGGPDAVARTILEDSATAPAGNKMPQIPGFAILIADARSSQQPIVDITPMNGLPMATRFEADPT
jgi:hypothetical protein